ncbi:MAG: SufS family cysteine desulfurase [Candidatus Izemoplasmatales bacterium]|nr:SufS family cysteine desulfurase [Candidatus Izemoplasmatales bacterium]
MIKNPWRDDFPQIHEGYTYLDTAAMSLKPRVVIEQVERYYSDLSVNVHRSLYPQGLLATELYEEVRQRVAGFIHADSEEIIFTRGATSALNLAAFALQESLIHEGDEVITSELEHHSSLLPWQVICQRKQAVLRYLPLTESGHITLEGFRSVLSSKTKVVALTYVSNVLGYVTPLQEIIHEAHQIGAVVIVDAAQAIQHIPIDVKQMDVDFLAFSGHKMCGPTGIGILYGKRTWLERLEPIEFGGDMNDEVTAEHSEWKDIPYKFEAGTMPIASVIGLGAAIDYLSNIGLEKIDSYVRKLGKYTRTLMKKIPGVKIYNPDSDSGIIAFNILGVPAHDAVDFFSQNNVAMRSGHHCAQLVSRFLNIDSCLRASFYLYNTFEDADVFVKTLEEAVPFFIKMGFQVII